MDEHEILFFDGLLGIESTFLKNIYIKLLKDTFYSEWDIRWAINGQIDIAKYLNIPVSSIINLDDFMQNQPKLIEIEEKHKRVSTLIFIETDNSVISYFLPYYIHSYLYFNLDNLKIFLSNYKPIEYKAIHDRTNIQEFIYIKEELKEIFLYKSHPSMIGYLFKSISKWPKWQIKYSHEGYNWLDRTLGIEVRITDTEASTVENILEHVFINDNSFYEQRKISRKKQIEMKQKITEWKLENITNNPRAGRL